MTPTSEQLAAIVKELKPEWNPHGITVDLQENEARIADCWSIAIDEAADMLLGAIVVKAAKDQRSIRLTCNGIPATCWTAVWGDDSEVCGPTPLHAALEAVKAIENTKKGTPNG